MRRPSFLPSLDSLEDQVTAEAANRPKAKGRHFDHPTARAIFVISLLVTVVAHVGALIWILVAPH